MNSDILGTVELSFPSECALSVYIIPGYFLGATWFSGSPTAFKGPEEMTLGTYVENIPEVPLIRLLQN